MLTTAATVTALSASSWITDRSNAGLLRSIICGCPGWQKLDGLDDRVSFHTQRHRVAGCTLQTDVVYVCDGVRDGDGASWHLASACLTASDRWAIDYVFESTTPARPWCVVREMSATGVRPLAGLSDVPSTPERALLLAVHPYMLKLGLVAAVLPIL